MIEQEIFIQIKNFIKVYGIQPDGIVMHDITFYEIRDNNARKVNTPPYKIFGKKIYRSVDVKVGEFEFVINKL